MNHQTKATMLTQYNIWIGIQLFGKEGKNAIEVELKQLNDYDGMEPINANNMLREEIKNPCNTSRS